MSTRDKINLAAGTVGEYEGGKALYNYLIPEVEVTANPVNTDYSEEKKEKKKSKFITSDRDF